MILALIIACLGALGYGVASVLESMATERATGLSVMIRPAFIAGVVCDVLAWAASVIALQHLTVFTVQSILAGSLAVTVIAARLILGTPVSRAQMLAMGLIGIGLVLVILSTGPQRVTPPPQGFGPAMIIAFGVLALGLAVLYRRNPPATLAVLAGLAFSGTAVAARGLHVPGNLVDHLGEFLLHPMPWLIVGFGVIGLIAYSRCLEGGSVGVVTAILWVTEVVVPGLIGMWVLGDAVREGWEWAKIVGLLATLGGCLWLALADGGRVAGEAGRASDGPAARLRRGAGPRPGARPWSP